jgi:hypothetical protein
MKNDTSQQPATWETPDMTVLSINDVTLGYWYFGGDVFGELS